MYLDVRPPLELEATGKVKGSVNIPIVNAKYVYNAGEAEGRGGGAGEHMERKRGGALGRVWPGQPAPTCWAGVGPNRVSRTVTTTTPCRCASEQRRRRRRSSRRTTPTLWPRSRSASPTWRPSCSLPAPTAAPTASMRWRPWMRCARRGGQAREWGRVLGKGGANAGCGGWGTSISLLTSWRGAGG